MDRHVVHALPRLKLHGVEKIRRPHVDDVVELLGHLVDRDRAHRHRGGGNDPVPHGVDLRPGGEVHHSVGPAADGQDQLLQLALRVARYGRLADVGIDLRPCGNANADRLQSFRQVGLVGRDHHPPPRHFVTHDFRIELLGAGDRLDFGRYAAGPGLFDLGHVRLHVARDGPV